MSAQTREPAADPRAVFDVIHRRRAVRAYTTEPLSEETVRTLLDAAVQAPTALHLEPWAFVVIQDRTTLKRYSDRAKGMLLDELKGHGGRSGLAASPHAGALQVLLKRPDYNIFYDAGTLIVICGRPLGSFVTADCWLAAENLMLAACALGLGSCCIGFAVAVLNEPEVKRELGIPAEVTAVAPLIVGVPSGTMSPVSRRPPEILRWVR